MPFFSNENRESRGRSVRVSIHPFWLRDDGNHPALHIADLRMGFSFLCTTLLGEPDARHSAHMEHATATRHSCALLQCSTR